MADKAHIIKESLSCGGYSDHNFGLPREAMQQDLKRREQSHIERATQPGARLPQIRSQFRAQRDPQCGAVISW